MYNNKSAPKSQYKMLTTKKPAISYMIIFFKSFRISVLLPSAYAVVKIGNIDVTIGEIINMRLLDIKSKIAW